MTTFPVEGEKTFVVIGKDMDCLVDGLGCWNKDKTATSTARSMIAKKTGIHLTFEFRNDSMKAEIGPTESVAISGKARCFYRRGKSNCLVEYKVTVLQSPTSAQVTIIGSSKCKNHTHYLQATGPPPTQKDILGNVGNCLLSKLITASHKTSPTFLAGSLTEAQAEHGFEYTTRRIAEALHNEKKDTLHEIFGTVDGDSERDNLRNVNDR